MTGTMKHTILYIYIGTIVLFAIFAGSCSNPQHVIVSPNPNVVQCDSSRLGVVDVTLNIPPKYISRRARIVVTPELIVGDSIVAEQLKPLVLDGSIFHKKNIRRKALRDYTDPYADYAQRINNSKAIEMPYHDTFKMPEAYERGLVKALVSHDGCGSCTGIDSLLLATVEVPPAPVVPALPPLGLTWMEPQFVVKEKLMKGHGTAHLQFIINKYDIVPSLGNNQRELEDMVSKLEPILNDTLATITQITIDGMASADGPLSFNTPLAANRAQSAKEWLAERLHLSSNIRDLIKTSSSPEGWQPVLDAMTRAGHPDSVKVKEILQRYAFQNDDVQEKYIRRLACWPDIREKFLQKDRKVDYIYAWTIRSFTTDQELIDMYKTRPDAFNEPELLRIAELSADDATRIMIYRYTLTRFPESEVAKNNLAILLERNGQIEEAYKVLGRE